MPSLLDRLTPWLHAPTWHIAFSGGLDSTVLLHQLAHLAQQHSLPPLNAVHVHHGLQSVADAWPAHCQCVCDALGIPLTIVRVQVPAGASLEQAARNARYQALAKHLKPDEILMTAQHRDDQAETLLFRLLRGAGVRGLAAMPRQRPLGQGTLVRPLLGQSRHELEHYARGHGLSFITDPSNQHLEFSRNYLRHRVMPVLTERWPQAASTLARAAAHLEQAQELLEEVARQDLQAAAGAQTWLPVPALSLAPVARLSAARQRNALQAWLAPLTRLPDAQHWRGWEDLRDAAPDASPVWALADGQVQRSAGLIYWLAGDWLRPVCGQHPWNDTTQPLALPFNGCVRLISAGTPSHCTIAYRQGGEVVQVPGRGHRDLKRLLNEAGVPAFARQRLPLLYIDGQLRAVANLPGLGSPDLQLQWQAPTSDQCLR